MRQAIRHLELCKYMTGSTQQATVDKATSLFGLIPTGMMQGTATLFMLVAGLVVAAGVVWRAMHLSVFAISRIDVAGETAHMTEAGLRVHVLPKLKGNFFTMQLEQAREVFQAQPWVKQAVVRRTFPNRLLVQVQEHQEVAYWGNDESNYRLLSSEGIVFDANPDEALREDLPVLNGPDEVAAQVLNTYRTLNPLFIPMHGRIARLSVDARGSWSLALDQDTQLALGNAPSDELARRVKQFVHTIGPVVSRYDKGISDVLYADLRYRSGYALRLKGLTTLDASASDPGNQTSSASGRR